MKLPATDISHWTWIVVNSSGGKDSQTALREVVRVCDEQGVPRERIVVSHQCLKHMEWEGTLDLVKQQASFYGLRLEVSSYRNADGAELNLLDYVRLRGKWPDNKNRFCTSEFKRGPGGRVITSLFREKAGDVLNVYGFRADESPARSKKAVFARNTRFSSGARAVWDWLPIHTWTKEDVWNSIRDSGVPWHKAYQLGMPRLSCVFCIFATREVLLTAGLNNPELLDEYCAVEESIGHRFQNDLSLCDVRDALRRGERPTGRLKDYRM